MKKWNMVKVLAAALIATAGISGGASASTVIMDFEDVTSPVAPATPYTSAGFTLTNTPGTAFDGIFGPGDGLNDNGTNVFGWCSTCGPVTITLSRVGLGAFDFISFDTARLELAGLAPDSTVIAVTGHLIGGGVTPTIPIIQTDTWTSVPIGFLGVTSVDFDIGPGDDGVRAHAFDNLTIEAVPEPGSLALFGLGLVGLWAGGRRRKS